MKEIRYSAKRQGQQTLSNEKGVGPETDKLKDKFKDGSIPLQTDFNQLIDIADVGRKACGQSPQQNGPGTGLKLGDDGTLNLKIGSIDSQDFSPLILEKDILSVDLGSGLINKTNGICVGQGNGITVNRNDVAVKLATNKGLTVDDNGIAIKSGNGIKVDADGVTIDPNKVLPKGMIVMFSGSAIPQGWALCDGNNGTPNLIDRFILGGKINDINSKNSATLSGSGNNKKCDKYSDNKVVSVNIKVNDTKLNLSQIPSHKHIGGMAYYDSTGFKYSYYYPGGESRQLDNVDLTYDFKSISNNGYRNLLASARKNPHYPYTSSEGSGAGHSHNANAIVSSHNHVTDVIPPYYILAFIMKL
ncbi:tail fiber protein [Xenorhabdus sp. Vera]|uniref:tail fiber protein n=1 Tax=Xenorhabdus koppenhoeferi TaxID=351659 RepID=UPI0019834CC3|nr:tail fiber protein [Xenorhabdus sp. Vera]MBD2811141.1 tail fiber protein [Xenorhabdus sp. Vera]